MSRPNCPYCGSIQTRYNSKSSSSFVDAYSCKNCGNKFVIEREVSQEPSYTIGELSQPKRRIISKVVGFIILLILVGIAYNWISKPKHHKAEQEESSQNVSDQELKPLNGNDMQVEEHVTTPSDETKQEFSKQAEEDAHAYTPTKEDAKRFEKEKKGIANSQDMNDTLSIKTTLREK